MGMQSLFSYVHLFLPPPLFLCISTHVVDFLKLDHQTLFPTKFYSSLTCFLSYTLSAAYASFMDDDVGSITAGKFADFVVLSGDLLKTNAQVYVLETYKGGVKVFSR